MKTRSHKGVQEGKWVGVVARWSTWGVFLANTTDKIVNLEMSVVTKRPIFSYSCRVSAVVANSGVSTLGFNYAWQVFNILRGQNIGM